jgi:hypothetical protein
LFDKFACSLFVNIINQRTMLETDILHAAVESLEKLTKADIHIAKAAGMNGHRWDALIDIRVGAVSGSFKVEVKQNVLPAMLPRIMDKLLEENGLLIAKYISSEGKALLENQGINYLDIAGNCFIRNDSGIFWQIKGEKAPEAFREIKHKAFNRNGIKLIYALLLEEGLVNETYQTMATVAGISKSTVGSVLEDLAAEKFIYQLNESQKLMTNRRELLSQWVTAFHQKLKPKLFRGRYRFAKEGDNWKNLDLGEEAFWGGEPAAALLTHYLQPGAWTVYTNLDRKALTKDLHLVPDPNQGNVEIYSLFWDKQEAPFVNEHLKTVSPLLVYADLTGSGNDRNLETAKRIYEQYLQNLIEPDNG